MATIQSQLRLNDGMSAVLRQVTAALDTCLASYEELQAVSGRAMNLESITDARVGLSEANAVVDDMVAGLQRVEQQQNGVNRSTREGNSGFDGMLSRIGQMSAAYLSIQGTQKLASLSDNVASAQARLSLIVDDGGSVADLEDEIFASAQRSRGLYMSVLGTVSKLGLSAGDAFQGTDEMIYFAELMNKNFVIAGASATEQTSAMYQLTQAMAAGRLQGDEYRSIIENAPLLASSIEDYMRNVQGVEGSMKDWASQGLLTADVIKAALFSSADEVEARFATMPMTWGQVWTMMGNTAIMLLDPLLAAIGWLANNLDIVGPIALGVAAAFLVFAVATHGAAIATKVWTAMQAAFNAVMALNPVFLIIMGVILLIAIIYAVVAAINKATGSTVSATGIICGAIAVAGAFIANIFITLINFVIGIFIVLWNFIAAFANFFANVFTDPVGAIARLFFDLADTVLSILQSLASAIDTLFGSNLAGSVQGWRDSLGGWVDKTFGQGVEIMANVSSEDWNLGRFEYGSAWDTGYNFGAGLGAGEMPGGGLSAGNFVGDQMAGNLSDIADNTGSAASSLKTTSEDLVYLRDIAEREAINRFTTSEIKVDMTGMSNRIDSSMDIDGVLSRFTDGVREALVTSAEGVHK